MGLTMGCDPIRTHLNYISVSLKDESILGLEDHFMIIMNKVTEPREVTLNSSFHMTPCVCTKYVTMCYVIVRMAPFSFC